MRHRRPLLPLAVVLLLAGCEAQFDQTFVVDRLSILSVQTAVQEDQAELMLSTDMLRMLPPHQLPALPRIVVRVLAVNPEELGGQDAIERYHWAIGDPPLEGVPTIVTEMPELVVQDGTILPALQTLMPDGEELTPQALADMLDEGPILVPLVVTVIAGENSATAVKLFTIRGMAAPDDEANRNPVAEELSMGDRVWSEELLEAIGAAPLGPYSVDRAGEVVFEIDPDDPGGDDGEVDTTMYVTGGTIGWHPDSMRIWVQQTPNEDYGAEGVRVFLVLRDLQGAQSWVTIEQELAQ